ncbi:hypothetical protein BT63DRAFT_465916 [Microthyrium microscopicum]|uniref:Uncharacterized protein n=1 Tax=Microthyrium microscopicum TaxID=703497 RepID=A0A6A6TUE1_9PEZI|nr:hypothetical protein BT63DRAFT_465916 [Microthyrium microscopicum]
MAHSNLLNDLYSPFLRLPTEIRFMVYNLTLVSELPLPLGCKHSGEDRKHIGHFIALLRTNRQIHLEASKVLYSQNVFIPGGECNAKCVTDHTYRRLIERVLLSQAIANENNPPPDLREGEDIQFPAIEVVKNLPSLRYLTVCFEICPPAWPYADKFDIVVKFYMRQIMRYRHRFPKISVENPQGWEEILNKHSLKGVIQSINFYMTDKSPLMLEFARTEIEPNMLALARSGSEGWERYEPGAFYVLD